MQGLHFDSTGFYGITFTGLFLLVLHNVSGFSQTIPRGGGGGGLPKTSEALRAALAGSHSQSVDPLPRVISALDLGCGLAGTHNQPQG